MGSRGCEGTRNQVRNTCIPRLRMTRHMARSPVRSCSRKSVERREWARGRPSVYCEVWPRKDRPKSISTFTLAEVPDFPIGMEDISVDLSAFN